MRNGALKTCVNALELSVVPSLCQCPQLLSEKMASETPGEGFDQLYGLRICPQCLWMLPYNVNREGQSLCSHKTSQMHATVNGKARSDI